MPKSLLIFTFKKLYIFKERKKGRRDIPILPSQKNPTNQPTNNPNPKLTPKALYCWVPRLLMDRYYGQDKGVHLQPASLTERTADAARSCHPHSPGWHIRLARTRFTVIRIKKNRDPHWVTACSGLKALPGAAQPSPPHTDQKNPRKGLETNEAEKNLLTPQTRVKACLER